MKTHTPSRPWLREAIWICLASSPSLMKGFLNLLHRKLLNKWLEVIGHVQSLAKWHCHLMAQSGKQLTNDEWHNLGRDSFNDFRISNPLS